MEMELSKFPQVPRHEIPMGTKIIDGRYEFVQKIKDSKFYCTYLALDRESNTRVIIKSIARTDAPPAFEMRLAKEASTLKMLSKTSLTAPIEIGSSTEKFFIVLPFTPGKTLREKLQEGPLPWQDVLTIGMHLLMELERAHNHGILHRDIKPENIIVGEIGGSQVTLIDFGSAWTEQLFLPLTTELSGTALYLSPEQGGLIDSQTDERSDLYSIGVVLFECLTHRPPYQGNSVGEVLRKHLTSPPPNIRHYQPEIPKSLISIVYHLLEKDPKNRYQTARAAREDLCFFQRHWKIHQKDPDLIVGYTDLRSQLALPAFIGRERETEELKNLLDKTASGKGGIAFIEAESGGGKTRLLREFLRSYQHLQPLLLLGQGVDQVARHPYQLLSGVVQGILSEISVNESLRNILIEALRDQQDTLISVFPAFHTLFPKAHALIKEPEHLGEQRTLRVLCDLLDAVGSRNKPAFIVLDDAQWGDELTLKLLSHWQQINEGKKTYTLLVLAFRTEEVAPDHAIRKLIPLHSIFLKPLDKKGISTLVQSMAGKLPDKILDLAYDLSKGSPFMASAVLRGAVESGMLYFGKSEWEVEKESLKEIKSSLHAATFLAKRFHILPELLLRTLKIAAVLGKEFEISLLGELSKLSTEEIQRLLSQAEERHILWKDSKERYYFAHDKLRETLIDLLDKEECKKLHQEVAETLQQTESSRHFEIAYHFNEAGEPKRALPHALKSAEEARSKYSLEIAEIQFRIAEKGVESADALQARKIKESLGDVLMLRGKYEDAERYFHSARELAVSPLESATVEVKLGELFFKRGDVSAAGNSLERGLSRLGYSVPKSPSGFLLRLLGEVVVHIFHCLLPRFFLGRKKAALGEQERLIIRIHSRLAYTYWFSKGRIPCLWTHLREINLAERYPPSLELAQAYSEHAPIATLVGWFSRGIEYVKRSLEIRKKLGDAWGEGQSLHFYGVVLYSSGRFEEAIEKCREAVRILNRTGDLWEVNTAEWHIAYCHYRLGNLKKSKEISQRVYQDAIRIGDYHAMGISLSAWSKASGGKIPKELIEDKILRLNHDDIHTTVELLQAEGIRLIANKKFAEAAGRFQEACGIISKAGLFTEYMVPAFPWYATSLRMQIENTEIHETFNRQRLLDQAFKVSKKSLYFSRRFKNNLPHALREHAFLLALSGKNKPAHQYLQRSLSVARSQGAQYELHRSLYLEAKLAQDAGWAIPKTQKETAFKKLSDMEANIALEDESFTDLQESEITPSLIDRFESILEVSQKIIAPASRSDLYESLQEAFFRLLRPESCMILQLEEVHGKKQPRILCGEYRNLSLHLLLQTESHGKPLVFLGEQAFTPSESFILSGAESAMCVPVLFHKKAELFVYLTHHNIRYLFGQEEEQLAGFLAALAATALENLSSIESLRRNADNLIRSNQELERYAFLASHDLQEPLRHLTLTSQLMEKELTSESGYGVSTYLKDIIQSSKRMRKMVADMLQYARIESSESNFEEVSLSDVISIAIDNLRERIKETGARITFERLPNIAGNRSQLVSLFQNLLGNALKFRSAHVPLVTIRGHSKDDELEVEIEDNGIGFDPKYADAIFEAFRRLHSQNAYPGTGIGLAACKKIITQHHGRIWATSQGPGGATFHFTFPLRHKGIA